MFNDTILQKREMQILEVTAISYATDYFEIGK
jgi:hypothetical protein